MAEDWTKYQASDESDSKPTDWSQYAETEKPGIIDRISEGVGKFADEHPEVRRFFTGTSPEWEEDMRKRGITDTKGPGLMEIPGIRTASDAIRKAGRESGSYWKGFGASLLGDVLDLASSGFDPRAAGTSKIPLKQGEVVPEEELPYGETKGAIPKERRLNAAPFTVSPTGAVNPAEFPIRRSSEVPYRAEPTPASELKKSIDLPIKAPKSTFEPPTDVARDFAPVGEEGDLIKAPKVSEAQSTDDSTYEMARRRFNMGLDRFKEGSINLVNKLDTLNPEEEPSFARTEGGKLAIGADINSLGKILGTSLYKGDIAPIATKELLQNSIDAVRHLGDQGNIDVAINHGEYSISVTDNGKGLTKNELETVFTDLGASGKRDESAASGGFGLAKASFLLGSEKVEVTSVAKDPRTGKMIENHFEGTPDDLMSGVDIRQRNAPDDAATGTHVKVFVPKDSYMYQSEDFVKKMASSSHDLAANIKLGSSYLAGHPPLDTEIETLPKAEGNVLTELDNSSAKTRIIIPKTATRATSSSMRLNLSNNGMYQGGRAMYFLQEVPNVPSEVTVDIRPKVPEGHQDYPFTANREELRGTVEAQVQKYIDDNIVKPSFEARRAELQKLYNSMPEIQVGKGEFPNTFGRKVVVYDPKGQITSEEMSSITKSEAFKNLANTIGGILDEILKTSGEMTQSLEKVGIIFQDGLHGIRIPNPGTDKAAILINPFQIIGTDSPDVASASILHTMLHEASHLDVGAHNEAFTIRLGDVYGKFGARRTVEAQEQILKTIADPNTGLYHPEIQEILQRYQESRGREGTQEDLLSGTGVKQAAKGGGKGSVSKGGDSDGERTTSAVNKLLNHLEEARSLNKEQQDIYRAEKAKRFAAFESVKATGAEGAAKSLGKLKGEYERVNLDRLQLSKEEVDTLFTAIKRANITPGEKARGYIAMFKLLEGGNVPQRNELKLLDDVFGNGFGDRIMELQGGLGAVSIKLAKAANTMKSMMTLIHFSAPLRQGLGLAHKEAYRDAFVEMFKYFGNKTYYDAAMTAIEQRPNYLLSREVGLFMSKPSSMLEGEEAFMNNYIPGLPAGARSLYLKNMYEASQRSYIGFLNKLRADTFDDMLDDAKKFGHEAFTVESDSEGNKSIVPSESTRKIASFINTASGRGSLGALDKITPELNAVIWSPRLIASRLSYLNPKFYQLADPYMRRETIKSLLAIAAVSSTVLAIAKFAGGKVSNDPTSADFHKARFKNTVLDPNGGFQQPIVAAARMIEEANRMREQKKARFGQQSIPEIGMNFLRAKESPMASLIDSIASAKQFTGGGNYTNRFVAKTSVQGEVINRFRPIFEQDFTNMLKDDPSFAEGLGLGVANLFGAGLQDYPEKTPRANFRMRPRASH